MTLSATPNLTRTRLSEANLREASLYNSQLWRADLSKADLSGTNLSGASLIEANLGLANLTRINITRANLKEADVSAARLLETIFSDTDLTFVRGLESGYHWGPSTLDYRTIAKSWPLPLAFLRSCGVPKALIDYLPSLLNEPFQFYSCFISYSSADEPFCRRLHSRMQEEGLRVWFAPHDIQGGQKLHEQIDQAIRQITPSTQH